MRYTNLQETHLKLSQNAIENQSKIPLHTHQNGNTVIKKSDDEC